jgi:hypothetical protein
LCVATQECLYKISGEVTDIIFAYARTNQAKLLEMRTSRNRFLAEIPKDVAQGAMERYSKLRTQSSPAGNWSGPGRLSDLILLA